MNDGTKEFLRADSPLSARAAARQEESGGNVAVARHVLRVPSRADRLRQVGMDRGPTGTPTPCSVFVSLFETREVYRAEVDISSFEGEFPNEGAPRFRVVRVSG